MDDRKSANCTYRRWDVQGFDYFMKNNNLCDIALVNGEFTWFGPHVLCFKKRYSMLKQKARLLWNLQGDKNTKFFHKVIQNRKCRNRIEKIVLEDKLVSSPEGIKEAFFNTSEAYITKKKLEVFQLYSLISPRLSSEEDNQLEENFCLEEVEDVLKSFSFDKAPGPDGRNSSFIALVPKVKVPTMLKDFRPICLINSVTKLLTKMLAQRLSKVYEKLIDENQFGFVKGLGVGWIKWIRDLFECLRISVLVNGYPSKEFNITNGLRLYAIIKRNQESISMLSVTLWIED
ncbi:uncharacterized protein LOC141696065 [Apium graveolens]|uniref:uncharacterized protein LOC141696065 n=1 Tax=Apium graveolens TaxID=4045 RepID=UPI003D7B6523